MRDPCLRCEIGLAGPALTAVRFFRLIRVRKSCSNMDLLPKSGAEFASAEYWEHFFKMRGGKAFEWYGEFPELCGILHKYIKTSDKVLVVGCGNSQLSADMYDVGYHSIVNIDISEHVIKQMTQKNEEQRPEMKFLQMDVMQMSFEDGEYSVVLDKGTLDALMPDSKPETIQAVDRMLGEVTRVLRTGGRYVCISLAQKHIVAKVLEYFCDLGWMVRVHRVTDIVDSEDQEFKMPVFIYVCTKFKKMPNMKQILEVSLFDDKCERLETIDQVRNAIAQVQQYGLVRQYVNKNLHHGAQLTVDLHSAITGTPRYTLTIVDSDKHLPNKFAVFIVPEGRETEWLFATDEGRLELLKNAGFERLVVVSFHRDQDYGSIETVKAELSSKVMELAPPGVGKRQVPFLSLGDDIGNRTIREQGKSELSGEYVVEDVDSSGTLFRRLVFLSSRNVVQSEAKLILDTSKKKGKRKGKHVIDASHLSCQHHHVMVAGLALLHDFQQLFSTGIDILLVGLGGGGLPRFLHEHFPKVNIDVVELDPAIVQIAEKWFGFMPDERMLVQICDGVEHIRQLAARGKKHHIVMFDVDAKDTSVGMSCPPRVFVEPDFLKCVDAILEPSGMFILNFVCRNRSLREEVLKDIKSVFKTLHSKKVPSEINEIIFAYPSQRTKDTVCMTEGKLSKDVNKALRTMQETLQANTKKKASDLIRLASQMEELTLL